MAPGSNSQSSPTTGNVGTGVGLPTPGSEGAVTGSAFSLGLPQPGAEAGGDAGSPFLCTTATSSRASSQSISVTAGSPIRVTMAHGDPAGPISLTAGKPAIVAATFYTGSTGAWGDDLKAHPDTYAELSPGVAPAKVTRANADMLGGLPYMTALKVTNPANGRTVILYKRDIGAGQPLSNTLDGYHYRIDLYAPAARALGMSGSGLVQITRVTTPTADASAATDCQGETLASTGTLANGFANPFPDGWLPSRLDMGYDGTFTKEIVAPFPGTVVYAASRFSNWGGYVELEASGTIPGLPTRTLYFAEGLLPALHAGQQVKAGQPIAIAVPSPWNGIAGNIEWGIAVNTPVGTPSNPYAESGAPDPAAMVLAFNQWVHSHLDVPASTDIGHAGYA